MANSSLHNVLIASAQALEKVASTLEATKPEVVVKEVPQTKTAAALAAEAKIGQLAKLAASKLVESGLVRSETSDLFASRVAASHATALEQLAKFAGTVPAHKLGSVVVDSAAAPVNAYEKFEADLKKHCANLRR